MSSAAQSCTAPSCPPLPQSLSPSPSRSDGEGRGEVRSGAAPPPPPSPAPLLQPHLPQILLIHPEEVPGLVQQRGPDLVAQLVLVARDALQVAAEQDDLRQPGLTAQHRAALRVWRPH